MMNGVSKGFPGVRALNKVDFDIGCREIHALVGANGAGKSTLVKILQGLYEDYRGSIRVHGNFARLSSPIVSQKLGISVVSQEFSLAENMSVSDNLFLGIEHTVFGRSLLVRRRKALEASQRLLSNFRLTINPLRPVGDLAVAEKQLVEIIKGLARRATILIMDEPTAALSREESERLYSALQDLKTRGTSIILISHRFDDIRAISDRVTVLRDGTRVFCGPTSSMTSVAIHSLMFGESTRSYLRPDTEKRSEVLLDINCLCTSTLSGISLSIRRGEVLGLHCESRVVSSSLLRALYGLMKIESGTIRLKGRPCLIRSPRDAIRAGIGFLSADRRRDGIVPQLSVKLNLALPLLPAISSLGIIKQRKLASLTANAARALNIRYASSDQPAVTLSGGNQQKLILARWLAMNAELFLFDEPTRGVDVEGKDELYRLIDGLKSDGKACLVVTSDMEELVTCADRIAVICGGCVSEFIEIQGSTPESIIERLSPSRIA